MVVDGLEQLVKTLLVYAVLEVGVSLLLISSPHALIEISSNDVDQVLNNHLEEEIQEQADGVRLLGDHVVHVHRGNSD